MGFYVDTEVLPPLYVDTEVLPPLYVDTEVAASMFIDTEVLFVPTPAVSAFLFVLEDLVLGGNFGFTFLDGGFLSGPQATTDATSTLTLQSADLTFWDITLTSGFLNMTAGAGPADTNPQGDSPDGTTYELSANDGGFLDVTTV